MSIDPNSRGDHEVMAPKRRRFTLTLEFAGVGDGILPLRQALKHLWRAHRLRCVAVNEAEVESERTP